MSISLKSSFDFEINLNNIDIEEILLNSNEVKGCSICRVKVYAKCIKTFICSANGHEFCENCYHSNPNRKICAICRENGMIELPKRQLKELFDLHQNKAYVCCPVNKKSVSDGEALVVSILQRGEITSFSVNVSEKDKQCSWEGNFKDLEKHLESCQHLLVPCPYCYKEEYSLSNNKQFSLFHKKEELDNHLKLCEFRPVSCHLCDTFFPFSRIGEHTMRCPNRVMGCIFDCGEKLPLCEHDKHCFENCPNYSVTCPWKSKLGCSFSCKRRDMKSHLRDTEIHLCLPVLTSCLECHQTFSLDDLQEHTRYCGLRKCSNSASGCCFEDFFDWSIRQHERKSCLFQSVQCENEGCATRVMKKDLENHHEKCINDLERIKRVLKRCRDEHEVLEKKATKYRRILNESATFFDDDEEEEEEEDTSETLGSDTETVSTAVTVLSV
jgi:hypothetical protein